MHLEVGDGHLVVEEGSVAGRQSNLRSGACGGGEALEKRERQVRLVRWFWDRAKKA